MEQDIAPLLSAGYCRNVEAGSGLDPADLQVLWEPSDDGAAQIAEALGAEEVPKSIVDGADYPQSMRPERRFDQRTAKVTRCRSCHCDGHYMC